jgi:hypothetical protein
MITSKSARGTTLSVVVVQVLSKQLSVQKQKPTYSVSKLFYAVVRLS